MKINFLSSYAFEIMRKIKRETLRVDLFCVWFMGDTVFS